MAQLAIITFCLSFICLFALNQAQVELSGSADTSQYWDCCKPSCAWDGKANVNAPAATCDINNSLLTNDSAISSCYGSGPSYMCADQVPWQVDVDKAYGFGVVKITGGSEESLCYACYDLSFVSGSAKGKSMTV